jgi:GTP pyrophosphokinase
MCSSDIKDEILGNRFQEALIYAARLHAGQMRKRSSVPYFAHLLGVTALVLEDGGNEDEAIAALLHDAVEDQGGLDTLADIKEKFGEKVAAIVLEVSDSTSQPKPPWEERKSAYIESIQGASPSAIRVSLADKVYNARSIMRDLQNEGERVWEKFNGGKKGTIWYYEQLLIEFSRCSSGSLVLDLERCVREIKSLA